MSHSNNYLSTIQNNFPEATLLNTLKDVDDVFSCSVVRGQFERKEHYHEYIELIYVTSSIATITVNKNDYVLESGDLLVIIPGDVHSISCSNNCSLLSIQADTNFLFSKILSNTDLHYSMPYMLSRFNKARLFKAEELDTTEIPKLIANTYDEYNEKNNFYKLAIRSNLTKIALFVFRKWDVLRQNSLLFDSQKDHDGIQRLSPILKTIEENYMQDLSVADMAKIAGMSYSFFSRYFKATMKLTFSEYLNSIRIQEAEKLLNDTDLTIAEIGEAVGFSNTSYFIAQFKKQFHITPKKYKSRYTD